MFQIGEKYIHRSRKRKNENVVVVLDENPDENGQVRAQFIQQNTKPVNMVSSDSIKESVAQREAEENHQREIALVMATYELDGKTHTVNAQSKSRFSGDERNYTLELLTDSGMIKIADSHGAATPCEITYTCSVCHQKHAAKITPDNLDVSVEDCECCDVHIGVNLIDTCPIENIKQTVMIYDY